MELGDGDGGCSGDDTATPDGDLELDLGSSVHWDDDTAAGNSLERGLGRGGGFGRSLGLGRSALSDDDNDTGGGGGFGLGLDLGDSALSDGDTGGGFERGSLGLDGSALSNDDTDGGLTEALGLAPIPAAQHGSAPSAIPTRRPSSMPSAPSSTTPT